jgi:hypothetical protein
MGHISEECASQGDKTDEEDVCALSTPDMASFRKKVIVLKFRCRRVIVFMFTLPEL